MMSREFALMIFDGVLLLLDGVDGFDDCVGAVCASVLVALTTCGLMCLSWFMMNFV